MKDIDITKVRFDADGLVPAIIQEAATGKILMLAYMNMVSLQRSLAKGETFFWSRSRGELWHKGETSGHVQHIRSVTLDCDGDALLISVDQTGNACHTGEHSCFFDNLQKTDGAVPGLWEVIAQLQRVIAQRKKELPAGSYTTYLFESGLDKILKKVGEEASETIIAAKNHNKSEMAWEIADLLYHLLVLLEAEGLSTSEIAAELSERAGKKKESRNPEKK
ncbi:MAG: bifunctional phosphoribosyl-AMP cyclohydrolase/phosphoribosyl-ATP diphosphatase HisIE [Ignavibacteria bacterium]|nr:bifunctional phosphoribosyl-AMP cyclohydrolase/phosphoribosyl-ATP diphosphatase HisIE [Ignavibacteria bacterium]